METLLPDMSDKKETSLARRTHRRGGSMVLLSFLFGLLGGILGWRVGPQLAHDLKLSLTSFFRDASNTTKAYTGDSSLPSAVSSEEALIIDIVARSNKDMGRIVTPSAVSK